MITTFMGLRVVPTTLDPIPDGLRALPGCLAMNEREAESIASGDAVLSKIMIDHVLNESARSARLPTKLPRRPRAVTLPSVRLSYMAAIYRGRH